MDEKADRGHRRPADHPSVASLLCDFVPGQVCARGAAHGQLTRWRRCLDSPEAIPAAPAGVEHVDVDLASKKVVVRGNVTREAVKEKVAKTGLSTEYWS